MCVTLLVFPMLNLDIMHKVYKQKKKKTIKWGINYHQLPIDKPKNLSFSNVQRYNYQSQDRLTFIMDGGTK
jgi:hypothetical protein